MNTHNIVVPQDTFDYLNSNHFLPAFTGRRHELKTINPYYSQVEANQKQFELRLNDRNFQVGDSLILREYDLIRRTYGRRQIRYVFNKRLDPLLEEDVVILDMGLTFKTLVLSLDRFYSIGDRLLITADEYLYDSLIMHVFFKLDYASGIGMKPQTTVLSVSKI